MWIRLFPSPFPAGDPISEANTLLDRLQRAGIPADRSRAAVAQLRHDQKVEIDLPAGTDLRELAEAIPSLTIEAID